MANVTLKTTSSGVEVVGEPGTILLQRLGKGKVVYDQVLWDNLQEGQYLQSRADEYIAQLLTNAGVAIVPSKLGGRIIREWLILGAFKLDNLKGRSSDTFFNLDNEASVEGKEGVEVTKTSEEGTVETRKWRRSGKMDVRAGAKNNMNSFFGIPDWARPTWDYYVAYAFATIDSAEEQDVIMAAGVDDIIKIYVNGKPLLHNRDAVIAQPFNEGGRYGEDTSAGRMFMGNIRSPEDVVFQKVHLRKGRNTVLVKCANFIGPWGFVVQVKEAKAPIKFGIE